MTEDEGEVLEVNTEECLTRLRFGRYVWQAEQLFGVEVSHPYTVAAASGLSDMRYRAQISCN